MAESDHYLVAEVTLRLEPWQMEDNSGSEFSHSVSVTTDVPATVDEAAGAGASSLSHLIARGNETVLSELRHLASKVNIGSDKTQYLPC